MPRYRYNELNLVPNEESWNRLLKSYRYQLNEKDKELTKYKRAFEILKDKLQLGVVDATKNGSPALFWLVNIGYDQLLDVDEYELLEELMIDDN